MTKTYARHVLERADAGLQAREKKTRAPKGVSNSTSRPAISYASVVLVMAMGAGAAGAATDGAVAQAGSSSQGKVRISLTIPQRIEASGLQHLVPPPLSVSEAGRVVGVSSGCVFGKGSGRYSLSAYSDEPYILNYAGHHTTAQVKTASARASVGTEPVKSVQFEGAGALGCAHGETNAHLRVTRANVESARTAKPSTYYGKALTLLISPE